MDADLEARWQEAQKQRNLTPVELKALVEKMEKETGADKLPLNWNQRVEASIRKRKSRG